MDKPSVSFVIPHHGRDAMLIETVRSIALQERILADEPVAVEVIVVTPDMNFNKQRLVDAIGSTGVEVPVHVAKIPPERTISHSRNLGASMAAGDYLAFIDSDIRLSPDWIDRMLQLIAQPEVVLTGAVQIPDHQRRMNDVIRSAMSAANVGDSVEALPGANLFLRRDVFESSDKFPEELQTCEDSVFTQALRQKGKLLLTDATGFVHLGEDLTLGSLFKKEIWRGKSNLDLLRDNSVSLSELPSCIVPVLMPMLLLVALVALLMGSLLYMAYFLSLALLPSVLYAQRLKLRSGVKLGFHKLITFYTIYFLARGIGMLQRVFERKGYLQVGVRTR